MKKMMFLFLLIPSFVFASPPEPDNNKEESLSGPFEVTDLPVWMTDEDGNRVEARFTGEIFVIIEK